MKHDGILLDSFTSSFSKIQMFFKKIVICIWANYIFNFLKIIRFELGLLKKN